MKKEFLFVAGSLLASLTVSGETLPDSLKQIKLEEVVVSSIRAGSNTPIAYSNLNASQIKKTNTARNIPFVLQTLPSVVAYSEDGLGVGNTSLRIRGTDATRINVTLNGMPLNNPESQEVYWVNIPDISNSLQSIQLQRGVGTSTNGSASFGASLSLKTSGAQLKPYAEGSVGLGSYNTFIGTVAAGTGIMKSGLSVDARYSRVSGDGYIRNGKVDHKSAYVALSYYTDTELIKLSYINGIQHTGITWEGISPEKMEEDRRYNSAGKYLDDNGKTQFYDNETDNYYSDIIQLVRTKQINENFTFNTSVSYNRGHGYYENYKVDQKFGSKFGLPNQIIDGKEYKKSDVIRRKGLANDLYVANGSLTYTGKKVNITGGGMYSAFYGNHNGKLLWVKYNQNIDENHEWYYNTADKKEFSTFAKAEYTPIENLSIFGDIQYRYIDYRMRGMDDDMIDITNKKYYSFINPKAGISYRFSAGEVYGSFSVANREPLRTDIKESVKGGGDRAIKPERMFDYEFGYRFASESASFNANFYYMDYKDQMVQTGKLNDVGYKLMENVPNSYRAGIELIGAYKFTQWLRADANLTLSKNKIKNYTAYYDIYNNPTDYIPTGKQTSEFMKKTNISFSPEVVGSGILTFTPLKDAEIALVGKFVGEQYYDNTSNKENQLDNYFVTNIVAGYNWKVKSISEINFQIFVNNVFDKEYIANASTYTDHFDDGTKATYRRFFPQAKRNFMIKLGVKF